MADQILLFDTLQVVVSLFCILMGAIGFLFPLHPKFDRNFGALLGILGLFYGARVLHLTRFEHLTASVFPVILFALFGRVFRLRSKPATRMTLLCACLALSITSLIGELHESTPWLAALFVYEFSVFSILVFEAFADAARCTHSYERCLKRALGSWLLGAVCFQVLDWILLKILHLERISAVLIIPFAYWMVFVLSSGGLRSFRREILNFMIDAVLIAALMCILYWRIPEFDALAGLKTGLIFFAIFVAYRTLRRRASLSESRHGTGFGHLSEINLSGTPDEILGRLAHHPWVKGHKLFKPADWAALKIENVVEELKAQNEPAVRPARNTDWLFLDALPDWLRQSFLFAWDALGADVLVYLPSVESVLSIRLHGFAQDPEFKHELVKLGVALRNAFEASA